MFFRSRNEKAETIEQTARTDSHRLCGDIRETHILHERRSGGGGFQPVRNRRKRVLFSRHDFIARCLVAIAVTQRGHRTFQIDVWPTVSVSSAETQEVTPPPAS